MSRTMLYADPPMKTLIRRESLPWDTIDPHGDTGSGLPRFRFPFDRRAAARSRHGPRVGGGEGPPHHRRRGVGRALPEGARPGDGGDAALRGDDLRVRP